MGSMKVDINETNGTSEGIRMTARHPAKGRMNMTNEIGTIEQFMADYDWEEVFKYANPTPVLGSSASADPFSRADVAEIIAAVNGDNDGPDWVGVFRLDDGRFAVVSAGCDYTGWGCQEDGQAASASSLEELVRLGLSDDERTRLGFDHPTDNERS